MSRPVLQQIQSFMQCDVTRAIVAIVLAAFACHALAVPPNKTPSVSIVAPSNGATFTGGSNITVTANATDSDGTIAKVDFYRGGTVLLGTRTTSPYSFVWSGVPAGSYALTAIATDNAGATRTSSSVSITVTAAPNTPPVVSIISPASGASYSASATVTISASATDSDGTVSRVDFYQGSTLLGTANTAPYAFTWSNVGMNTYALTARAFDNLGASATSAVVNIVVGPPNQAPLVVMTAPPPCSVFDAPASIVLNADAVDPDGSIPRVDFLQGTTIVATAAAPPYLGTWSNVPSGVYALSARATDNQGAQTTSTPVTVTVRIANRSPLIALTAPANGATYTAPATIDLTASASDPDGTIAKVEFYAGSTLLATKVVAPYSFSWPNVPGGVYSLTAKATDNLGAVTTCTAVNVTVRNVAPAVSMTAPPSGASFGAGSSIALAATATDSDGVVTKVEFLDGGAVVATVLAAPYAAIWSTTVTGSHTLTARATDNGGGVTTSQPTVVNIVANPPPSVVITSPLSGASYVAPASVPLAASASDPNGTVAKVDFFAGSTLLATAANAPFVATWSNAPAGNHSLSAVATDNQGAATTSVAIPISIDAPPAVAITAPADGTVYTPPASIDLTVRVTDADGTLTQVDLVRDGVTMASVPVSGNVNDFTLSFHWRSVPSGTYVFTAHGTDNRGAVTASVPVHVTVHSLPSVQLTTPGGAAGFHPPATIDLAATATTASGAIASVSFFAGGTLIGTRTAAPYTASWSNVPAGTYFLTAAATDDLGYVGTSPVLAVTVSTNNAPTVTINSPTLGTTFHAPATVIVSADAADTDGAIAKVDFYRDTTLIGTATSQPYTATSINLPSGRYALTAVATDNLGATAVSGIVSIDVSDNYPPTVNLTVPGNGSSLSVPATLNLVATANDSDGSVAKVEIFQGGTLLRTLTSAPYTVTLNNVGAGNYTFTALATDNLGASAYSAPVTISVTAQALAIGSPAANSTIANDTITVSGSVQAPANSGVTVNGVVAAIDRNGNFHARGIALVPGANSITATLTTPDGQATTQSVSVTSSGSRPVKISASPTEGVGPFDVVFSVTAQAGTTIQKAEIDWNGDGIMDAMFTRSDWTQTVNYYGVGTFAPTVRVTDTDGNVYVETFYVVLLDAVQLDQNLRAAWSGFTAALSAGNKAAAMNFLNTRSQAKFGPVFDVLLPTMTSVLASWSDPIATGSLSAQMAEYAIVRSDYIFFVYFVRDADGVWRIDEI